MLWPNGSKTRPKVTYSFGPRKPIHTPAGTTGPYHYGTDFIGFSTIKSVAAGVVTFVGVRSNGGGYQIEIQHDGFISRSFHLVSNSSKVKKGQRVKEGQALGKMGTTGMSTGVHLHLEIIVNGKRVDPVLFIDKAINGGNMTWDYRGYDYVNDKPVTKDSQVARAHQYGFRLLRTLFYDAKENTGTGSKNAGVRAEDAIAYPGTETAPRSSNPADKDFMGSSWRYALQRIWRFSYWGYARAVRIEDKIDKLQATIEAMASVNTEDIRKAVADAITEHDKRSVVVDVRIAEASRNDEDRATDPEEPES